MTTVVGDPGGWAIILEVPPAGGAGGPLDASPEPAIARIFRETDQPPGRATC